MPGKRPRPLQRTQSVSLLNFDAIGGQCSPLPEHHPIEKQKAGKGGPVVSACRQVIGFAPKAFVEIESAEKKLLPAAPGCGGHRSGLCDLLADRPCLKKEAAPQSGIGLGILAALERKDVVASSGRGSEAGEVGEGLMSSPKTPAVSHPIPIQGVKAHLEHVRKADAFASQYHRPREQSGVKGEEGEGKVAQGVEQNESNSLLLAWPHSTDALSVGANKLFMSLSSSTPVCNSAAAAIGYAALNFLDACNFCKRRFGEDRDIYMYRGDKAFCSVECRHHQIVQDERLEKCVAAITPARHMSNRNRVMAVAAGTAAAA